MNPRRPAIELKRALSVGLFCLGFTRPGLAQEDTTPATNPPPDAPAPEAEKPAAEPAPAEAKAEVKVDAPADKAVVSAPAESAPAPVADPERDKTVGRIGIELLPGSAYPEPKPRGIKGGSLWSTMHGLQWPYMPAIPGQPATRVGISGSIWNDVSYSRIISGLKDKATNRTRWATQGRGVLRVTPTHSTEAGWFAQGQAEFVAQGDQTTSGTMGTTDDLYVRFGKWNLADLTVGRFQGWELAHYGMGLDLNTLERDGARVSGLGAPPPVYGLTYMWDRKDLRVGYYALHAYPTKFLRFELLSQLGSGSGAGGNSINTGIRPMGILDFGFVKLKAGYEFSRAVPQEDDRLPLKFSTRQRRVGYGAALQVVVNPYIEAGGHYAVGMEDVRNDKDLDDLSASNTTWSAGGFLNGRVIKDFIVGGGILKAHVEDLQPNAKPGPDFGEVDTQDQFFGYFALQYSLWDSVYFKFVGSHAWFRFHDYKQSFYSNNSVGGRFRMMVVF